MSEKVFWDRLEKINAGMLSAGESARFLPMSHRTDREARRLWFIATQGNELVEIAESGEVAASYIVADGSTGLYAQAEGTLALSQDRAKLDEIWDVVGSSWFEKGKDDPDLRLLCFAMKGAEVWTNASGVNFVYQVAKAQVTGDKPDVGDHFSI